MRGRVALGAFVLALGALAPSPAQPSTDPGKRVEVEAAAASAHSALDGLDRRIDRMLRSVRAHERTLVRMIRWFGCVHPMAVDQVGDLDHEWGFEYDERDGSGLDTRTALVRHRGGGRSELRLLRFGRARHCVSRAPDPNGTGADARVPARPRSSRERGSELRRIERRTARLERRIERLEDAFDLFDEWESCLSWLPVTEYGHDDHHLGYLVEEGAGPTYGAAIDIDGSEWDDPDYMLLAFLGRDRPFHGECGHEPGESVDRPAPFGLVPAEDARRDRLADLRRDLRAAGEDLEDLVEPVQEFVQFDECMFTVGVRERSGYRFRGPAGGLAHRAALAFDMTGLKLPEMDVMAFPGEEPPQIECNEDAGGQDTDE